MIELLDFYMFVSISLTLINISDGEKISVSIKNGFLLKIR